MCAHAHTPCLGCGCCVPWSQLGSILPEPTRKASQVGGPLSSPKFVLRPGRELVLRIVSGISCLGYSTRDTWEAVVSGPASESHGGISHHWSLTCKQQMDWEAYFTTSKGNHIVFLLKLRNHTLVQDRYTCVVYTCLAIHYLLNKICMGHPLLSGLRVERWLKSQGIPFPPLCLLSHHSVKSTSYNSHKVFWAPKFSD